MSENRVPLLNPRKTSCFVKTLLRNGNLLKWKPQWIISLIFTICLESLKSQEEASEEEKPSEGNWSDLIWSGPCSLLPSLLPAGALAKQWWSEVMLGRLMQRQPGRTSVGHSRTAYLRWFILPPDGFLFYKDLEKAPYLPRQCLRNKLTLESAWHNKSLVSLSLNDKLVE